MQVILAFSCTHFPAEHPDALDFLRYVKDTYVSQEDELHVVMLGDMFDWQSINRHGPPNPDLPSSSDELKMAKTRAEKLFKIFPTGVECQSNHGARPDRVRKEAGLPAGTQKLQAEIQGFPTGWKMVPEHVINTPLGSVYFCHGHGKTKSTFGLLIGRGGCESTVQGHLHEKAAIDWISTAGGNRFSAFVGCLVDRMHPALEYAKENTKRQMLSVLLIEDGIPRPIIMDVDKNNRWRRSAPDFETFPVSSEPAPIDSQTSSAVLEILTGGKQNNGYWNKSRCLAAAIEAEKSEVSFKDFNASAYQAARKNGWLEECRKHCPAKKAENYTKERCIEICKEAASAGKTFKNFNASAYRCAVMNGWLDDCHREAGIEVAEGRDGKRYLTHWSEARRSAL